MCPGGPGVKPDDVTVVLEDIDECAELPMACRGGQCRNTYGSFVCICPRGNRLDLSRRMCVGKVPILYFRISVLLIPRDIHPFTQFVNLISISCPRFFSIYSWSFADVNECEVNSAICGVGTCINTEGNYTCICPEGHLLMPDRNCMGKLPFRGSGENNLAKTPC